MAATTGAETSINPHDVADDDMRPAVRGVAPRPAKPGDHLAPASRDLLDHRDQQQQQQNPQLRVPASGTSPSACTEAGRPLIQERPASGRDRAEALVAANGALPPRERSAAADEARLRGNEAFRVGSYHEAAAEYTLCLGLAAPGAPCAAKALANRAATHLKLRAWTEAVDDAGAALAALDAGVLGRGKDADDVRGKVLLRRAEACSALGAYEEALKVRQASYGDMARHTRALPLMVVVIHGQALCFGLLPLHTAPP